MGERADLGTCERCGANMRRARIEHRSAIKGDDDWSDVVSCTNVRCPDYIETRPLPAWCKKCLHPGHVGVCDVTMQLGPPSPITTAGKCGCVIDAAEVSG